MNKKQIRSIALVIVMVLSVFNMVGTTSAASSTEISLEPSTQTVDEGNSTTYDVVIENASGGVGSYEFDISTDDISVANITDVTLQGDPASQDVNFAADNSSVEVTAAIADTADSGRVTAMTVTVSGVEAGDANLDLQVPNAPGDEAGNTYTVTGVNDATVTVSGSGTTSPASSTEISLEPSTQTVNEGDSTTYDVVIENASGGVGSYEFDISTDDISVANITDVTLQGDPASQDVNFAADNSSVEVTAAIADTADSGRVTAMTVTVSGVEAGDANLDLQVPNAPGDEAGNTYTVTGVNDATVTVSGSGGDPFPDGEPIVNSPNSASEISSAISSVPGGTKVTITGTSTISGPINVNNDVQLVAEGDITIQTSSPGVVVSSDGATVEGFTIEGPFSDSGSGANPDSSEGILIEDGVDDVVVANNVIDGAAPAGIRVAPGSGTNDNITITNNEIIQTGDPGTDSDPPVVEDNGIQVEGEAGTSDSVVITNNVIENTNDPGVATNDESTGNGIIVDDNGGNGDVVAEISGNEITDSAEFSIRVQDANGDTDGQTTHEINGFVGASDEVTFDQQTALIENNAINSSSIAGDLRRFTVEFEDGTFTQGESGVVNVDIRNGFGDLADETVNAELQFVDEDSGATTLDDDTTNNGEISFSETFDRVDDDGDNPAGRSGADTLFDYPTNFGNADDTGDQPFPDDSPAYRVVVSSDASGDSDANAQIPAAEIEGSSLLSVELNLTEFSESGLTYDGTTEIDGVYQQADGTGVGNYKIELFTPDDGTIALAEDATTSQNGQFIITAVTNDAGDWTLATNPNEAGAFEYRTVTVDARELDVTLESDGDDIGFQQTLTVNVSEDDSGIATSDANIDGYVNITGPFESVQSVTGSSSSATGVITSGLSAPVLRAVDNDDDSDLEYIHVATSGPVDDTEVTFQATPASSLDASLENGAGPFGGLEVTDDAGDTPSAPDYVGSAQLTFSNAEPVNIVDLDIEDGQDGLFTTGSATPSSIFSDDGPSVLEPLPLSQTPGTGPDNRITDEFRVGNDLNRGLGEFTQYRVTFDLADIDSDAITADGSVPGSNPDLEEIRFVGAGINSTAEFDGSFGAPPRSASAIVDNNGDLQNVLSVTETSDGQYTAIIRATAVDEPDEEFNIIVEADGLPVTSTGDANQPDSIDTTGLNVSEFEVDGVPVDEIAANQSVNLTAQVQNPGTDPTFVNNGRVNVSQAISVDNDNDGLADTREVVDLGSFDARTGSVNNGQYSFDGLDIRPRGIDTNEDGISEEISQVVFTAYQYTDADGDNTLERSEVNNATLEPLELQENPNINVEFVNATIESGSDEFAGVGPDGNFTLTSGVEYEDITVQLVRDDGTPVDLTDGVLGADVSLDNLEEATVDFDGDGAQEQYVGILGAGAEHEVEFDEDESNPTAGVYQIDDIEDVSTAATGVVVDSPSSGTPLTDGDESDNFVIDSTGIDGEPTLRVFARTPDTSNATATDEGLIDVENAQIETNVSGVAGNAVPNSVNDTDNDGDLIDELNNDQSDSSRLNTTVSEIETPTGEVNRVYRLNATVTDALGTPLNSSEFNEIDVDFDGSVDPVPTTGDIPDNAKFEMVDGPGVTTNSDDGVTEDLGTTTNDEVEVTNENGEFQFDIEVESGGNDGEYTPVFEVEAQSATASPPAGKSDATQSPTVQNPVVNVLDQSGAELPQAENSANEILAQDVENRLRIEAFQADEDGFTLADGLAFGFTDPKAETTAGGTTTLSQDVVTSNFTEGQVAFIRVTPTGTGDGVVALTNRVNGVGASARDTNGTPLLFNTLRSNLQVNITLSTTSVEAGQSVTATLSQASTDERLPANTRVSLVNPDGTEVNSALTNADGEAELTVPADATSGTFTVETRPAGFEPNSVNIAVTGDGVPEDPDDSVERFDTNGEPGIQADEVLNAISAFNEDTRIGGEPVEAGDVLDVISAFNEA